MIRPLILCALLSFGCTKPSERTTPSGLREHIVPPSTANSNIKTYNDPNYAYVVPDNKRRNQLLLFLPGTGAEPKNYRKFIRLAAEKGYHAIGLMYPNKPAVNELCAGSADITAHSRARLEIIDGTDRHPGVTVDRTHCIIQRLTDLLHYLDKTYPDENWAQFLAGNQPAWEKVLAAGHSQGAGHAGVMGKHYPLRRVILFSGIDFLTDGQIPDWVQNTTRHNIYYALHHEKDELLDINIVKSGWTHLGMTPPVSADSPIPPTAQTLITTATPALLLPLRFHNMTAVDVFAPASIADNAWLHFLQ
ncbi:BPSS1187 family protein [Chitinophaga caseinilytica]|uniref:Alpha/beta hydrolase n=1 Tax=Chitinophaga caseinilytica TaxID=2267521 RepID=A0ABZ2ZDX6_9BACT